MSNFLLDDKPIYTTRSLAIAVGINESLAIQQLHWVIKVKEEHQDDRTLYEGVLWCKYTLSQWQGKLPWMSVVGVRKMLKRLEIAGVLLSCQPNAKTRDQTKWYRIDYDRLNNLEKESQDRCYSVSDEMRSSVSPLMRSKVSDEMRSSVSDDLYESLYLKDFNKDLLNKDPLTPKGGTELGIEIPFSDWEPEPEDIEIQDQENSDRIRESRLRHEEINKPLPLAKISGVDQLSSAAAAKKSKATSPTKAQIAQCFEAFRSKYNLLMGDIWAECAKPNELRLKAFTHLWKEHGESLFESLDYASRHLHETTWSMEKAWSIDTMMRPGKMTGYAEMGKKVIDPEAARTQRLNKLYETFSEAI